MGHAGSTTLAQVRQRVGPWAKLWGRGHRRICYITACGSKEELPGAAAGPEPAGGTDEPPAGGSTGPPGRGRCQSSAVIK